MVNFTQRPEDTQATYTAPGHKLAKSHCGEGGGTQARAGKAMVQTTVNPALLSGYLATADRLWLHVLFLECAPVKLGIYRAGEIDRSYLPSRGS